VPDGWWIEGHVENVTGWSIVWSLESENIPSPESVSLYDKLENIVLPMYY
jgi:starch phosphorylase